MAAYSEGERDAWLQAIQLASYDCMRSQLMALQQRVELHRGQDPDLDVYMWRIRRGHTVGKFLYPTPLFLHAITAHGTTAEGGAAQRTGP